MNRLPAILLAGALALAPAAGLAEPEPLSDAELAEVRGGLMTPLGLEVGFAAEVRTYIDGELAIRTRMVWTETGMVTEQDGPRTGSGGASGWSAIVPSAAGGETNILQSLGDGRILSVVLNTASQRNIRQDADLTLQVPQLADLQRQVALQRLSASLASEVGGGLTAASRTP